MIHHTEAAEFHPTGRKLSNPQDRTVKNAYLGGHVSLQQLGGHCTTQSWPGCKKKAVCDDKFTLIYPFAMPRKSAHEEAIERFFQELYTLMINWESGTITWEDEQRKQSKQKEQITHYRVASPGEELTYASPESKDLRISCITASRWNCRLPLAPIT